MNLIIKADTKFLVFCLLVFVCGSTKPTTAKTTPDSSDETTSDEELSSPSSGETTSDDEESSPGSGESSPDDKKSSPGSGETTSGDKKSTKSGGKTTSDDKKSSPGSGETTSDDKKSSPSSGETTSDDKKSSPGSGETTSDDKKKSTPSSGETTSDDKKKSSPSGGKSSAATTPKGDKDHCGILGLKCGPNDYCLQGEERGDTPELKKGSCRPYRKKGEECENFHFRCKKGLVCKETSRDIARVIKKCMDPDEKPGKSKSSGNDLITKKMTTPGKSKKDENINVRNMRIQLQ